MHAPLPVSIVEQDRRAAAALRSLGGKPVPAMVVGRAVFPDRVMTDQYARKCGLVVLARLAARCEAYNWPLRGWLPVDPVEPLEREWRALHAIALHPGAKPQALAVAVWPDQENVPRTGRLVIPLTNEMEKAGLIRWLRSGGFELTPTGRIRHDAWQKQRAKTS